MKIRPLVIGSLVGVCGLAVAFWLFSRAAPAGATLRVASQKGGTKAVMLALRAIERRR